VGRKLVIRLKPRDMTRESISDYFDRIQEDD